MKTILLFLMFVTGCAGQPTVTDAPKPPAKKPKGLEFIDILEQVQS